MTQQSVASQYPSSSSPWIEQARLIVSYPQDFGMTRRAVKPLGRLLAKVDSQPRSTERLADTYPAA